MQYPDSVHKLMTMYEEAGSGKTNLSSYLQYQASTFTEVSKFHQGGKKTLKVLEILSIPPIAIL